jgi:SWIM/SEC-C metal-binding protein
MERADEVLSICERNGWKAVLGVEPDKPEDVTDLERLLGATRTEQAAKPATPKVGRDDPCPCGSGRKFKRCCGSR